MLSLRFSKRWSVWLVERGIFHPTLGVEDGRATALSASGVCGTGALSARVRLYVRDQPTHRRWCASRYSSCWTRRVAVSLSQKGPSGGVRRQHGSSIARARAVICTTLTRSWPRQPWGLGMWRTGRQVIGLAGAIIPRLGWRGAASFSLGAAGAYLKSNQILHRSRWLAVERHGSRHGFEIEIRRLQRPLCAAY